MVIRALVLHGEGCLDWAQSAFDVAVNALQDNDGILDALPDREPNQPPNSATSGAYAAIPCLKSHNRTPR